VKPENLCYHNDWNKLMDVFFKAKSIDSAKISECITNFFDSESVIKDKGLAFEMVYNGLIEFIKWYNQNKAL
jgi:hypothetical protein